MSPTIRAFRPRKCVGRSYPITSSAVRTAARVVSEIPGFPFRTRLTVASLTPACFATSASLPAMPQVYVKGLQEPQAIDRVTRRTDGYDPMCVTDAGAEPAASSSVESPALIDSNGTVEWKWT